MSKTRIHSTSSVPAQKKLGPKNIHEWNALLSRAIQQATATSDRRVEGLRKAMTDSRAEKILRQMSILSDADLDREFPVGT